MLKFARTRPPSRRPGIVGRKRLLWLLTVPLLAIATITGTYVRSKSPAGTSTSTAPTSTAISQAGTSIAWMSGGSGSGLPDGSFANWRGSATPMMSTWSDAGIGAQAGMLQFGPGSEYPDWSGSSDVAIGAIFDGQTWAAAATGAYDAQWSTALTNIKTVWLSRPRGTLYLRFAHEMNGNWYPWSVDAADIGNFQAAWRRFYNLKEQIFPAAELVFGTNAETSGQSYDWRTIWPGDQYVDVYSTDYYSNHWVDGGINATDGHGAPVGIEQHRLFAQAHGKPIGVSEWGNNIDVGDRPDYIQAMYNEFSAHGGSGAGHFLYEDLFNAPQNNNQFQLFPDTRAPQAAAKYKALFSGLVYHAGSGPMAFPT